MRYAEFVPPPSLARWVKCFWIVEDPDGFRAARVDRIVPDGCPELIVHYGARFREIKDGQGGSLQPRSILAGQLTQPLELQATGAAGMVAARFWPAGAFRFFRQSMTELVNERVALDALCHGTPTLEERVASARTDRERVQSLSDFLMQQLARQRPAREVETVERCVQSIRSSAGQISLDRLARLANLSARQVERNFQRIVGLPPKLLARILRFHRVLGRLESQEPWALVALQAGFFDQAHLVRDFKRFSGQPPTDYLHKETLLARCLTREAPARS